MDDFSLADAVGGGGQQAGSQQTQSTWPGGAPAPQAWPGQPGQPGAPAPQGWPGQPGQPGAPAPQGWPGQPGQPGAPAPQGWPGQPGQPGAPAPQGWPGQPGAPTQPGWPGQPGAPAQSGWPGQPGGPPAQPGWPAQPGQPSPSAPPAWPPQPTPPGGQPPSGFPTAALTGPLTVPYSMNLPRGIYDKMLLTIDGEVKPNGQKFIIDFKRGKDIVFHLNPRLNDEGKKTIVRNSMIGNWGQEERHLTAQFPFVQGKPFQMKILCTPTEYRLAVNKAHILEFKHRLKELASINEVSIYGDVTLKSVNLETLP